MNLSSPKKHAAPRAGASIREGLIQPALQFLCWHDSFCICFKCNFIVLTSDTSTALSQHAVGAVLILSTFPYRTCHLSAVTAADLRNRPKDYKDRIFSVVLVSLILIYDSYICCCEKDVIAQSVASMCM